MSGQPSTTKEALLAELLGDVQLLLDRVEAADQSAKATAAALNQATTQYRVQVDTMVATLRTETSHLILKTTESAAHALVGQQTATLRQAAAQAIQHAMGDALRKTTRRSCYLAGAMGGLTSGALVAAVLLLM